MRAFLLASVLLAASAALPASAEIDLVERFAVADIGTPIRQIDFRDRKERAVLSGGWRNIIPRPQYQLPLQWLGWDADWTWPWTEGRAAVLELPVIEPSPRVVHLTLAPLTADANLPKQSVRFLWNDRPLGEIEIERAGQRVSLKIPAAVQRRGTNQLDVLPRYWVVPKALGAGPSTIGRGVHVSRIEIEHERPPLYSGQPAADPTGRTIRHPPGSTVSYYVVVPTEAELRAAASVGDDDSDLGAGSSSRIAVDLTDQSGQQRNLWASDRSELGGAVREISVDLTPWAGQMVALTLSHSVVPDALGASGVAERLAPVLWLDPRISSPTPDRESARPPLRRFNILLILFDTLRPDFVAPYGGDVATPALSALAASGTTFDQARSNSSWTRTSVTSLLTGVYPFRHAVIAGGDHLAEGDPYLPEILQARGFHTMAIMNNAVIAPEFGYGRGFDAVHKYYELRHPVVLKDYPAPAAQADLVWDEYVDPFLGEAGAESFFIYLHEIDPHAPFDPPAPFGDPYAVDYKGNIDAARLLVRMFRRHAVPLDAFDVEYLQSRYRGEIAFMDAYLARLMQRLERSGVADDTLVLFASDHGEEFMEHGTVGHYWNLYEEVLRVPMIWRLPGMIAAGQRVPSLVELLDVPPTLLDLLGIPIPEAMEGRSLRRDLSGEEEPPRPRWSFARVRSDGWTSARYGDWKLLREYGGGPLDLPRLELYDLADDPGETRNRWAEEWIVGKTLSQELAAREAQTGPSAGATKDLDLDDLDPKVVEQLRVLGYVE